MKKIGFAFAFIIIFIAGMFFGDIMDFSEFEDTTEFSKAYELDYVKVEIKVLENIFSPVKETAEIITEKFTYLLDEALEIYVTEHEMFHLYAINNTLTEIAEKLQKDLMLKISKKPSSKDSF